MTPSVSTTDTGAVIEEIARCRPELARDIVHVLNDPDGFLTEPGEIELSESRRGAMTLRIAGRYVHSRIDPEGEAQKRITHLRAADQQEVPDGIVLVGLGLGYLLDALGDARDVSVLAVVFSADLLRHALTIRSVEWWCTRGPDRIVPVWLPGVIPVVLRDLTITTPKAYPLDAITARWPDSAEDAIATVRSAQERNQVNRNTLRRFGKLWVRNGIRNLALSGAIAGIDTLEGIATGIPALVCGAGPTLDDLAPFAADLAKRHLIIAVDTALPVLQRWGVTPHLAVVSDPQYWNTRHLDRVVLPRTVLVVEPATHPRTLRLWRGPIIVSASIFPLGEFFDERFGRTLKLGAGGSVATSAWDLARILGSREIALAGIDLGFPGGHTHCADSFFENRLRHLASRLAPAEHGMSRYLHGAGPQEVPAAGGSTVLSDRRMDVYRSWFSEQAHRYPEVVTTLLSPQSSAIAGIGYESPDDRVSRLPPVSGRLTEITDRCVATAGQSDPQEPGTRGSNDVPERITAESVLVELREELARIETLVHGGIATCEILANTESPRLDPLDRIDAELTGTRSRNLAGFLAVDALESEARNVSRDIGSAIAQAKRIYQAIARSCTYHIGFIDRLKTDRGVTDKQSRVKR